MTYIPVHVSHVGTSQWEAYIPFYDEFVHETSKPKVEAAAYEYLERAWGLRAFNIIWQETP